MLPTEPALPWFSNHTVVQNKYYFTTTLSIHTMHQYVHPAACCRNDVTFSHVPFFPLAKLLLIFELLKSNANKCNIIISLHASSPSCFSLANPSSLTYPFWGGRANITSKRFHCLTFVFSTKFPTRHTFSNMLMYNISMHMDAF